MNEPTVLVENLSTELIKVSVAEGGISRSCFCTSMHLVDDKVAQLRKAIHKISFDAFIENKAEHADG